MREAPQDHVVDDWIRCGKFSADDITLNALKTGPWSVSDIALTQLALRGYLLGPWIDPRTSPAHEEQVP